MLRTSRRALAALVAIVGGLSIVAAAPPAAVAAARPSTARVISSTTDGKFGTILVAGTTVYTVKRTKTGCTTACQEHWPPVLLPRGVEHATAGVGVDASKLGTASATKGRHQVTYAGKRLYWSVKDKARGQVHTATNKWGTWSTVTISSETTTTAPATTAAPPTDATAPPATAAPETSPPETAPPATAPPETQPTSPPPTNPPPTTSGGNGGIGF